MKYLMIGLLFLIGCGKSLGTRANELIQIKTKAILFCKCQGGVSTLSITEYDVLNDTGWVRCKSGGSAEVSNMVIVDTCP
jgi:hypothetical protein